MRIERTFAGKPGEAIDMYNESTGQWLGWARPVKGIMTLQSTGAPLSDKERGHLASIAGRAAGELVVA
jgi:hypothetical protein